MKRFASILTLPICILLGVAFWSPAQAEMTLGGGIHYWTALDDIEVDDVNIDESGASFIGSLQWVPGGPISFEVDVEYFDEGFGGGNAGAVAPQAFVLVGGGLYGGLGIGVTYNDELEGNNFSDPFYTARVGVDIVVLPKVHLDIHGNYIFNAFSDIDGANEDSITLGAIARIEIW